MTGVPVTPSGEMLPQASDERGTGLPSERLQSSLPLAASIATTTLSSVATINIPEFDPGARQYKGWL
jgi:hypothetical protein